MANVSIQVQYRVEWLPVICGFVAETARAFGANEKECSDLYLAAEETAMHIIESVPRDGVADTFDVSCYAHPAGVEYVFRNTGMPLKVEDLPEYDQSDPEDSVEGLRLFLARRMVDAFDFVNHGRDGWRTRFLKKLKSIRTLPEPAGETETPSAALEKISTTVATPADAFDIVQLAYLNYRYSYANESFYFAEKLEQDLASGKIVSFIARTESGLLVGQIGLIRDDLSPTIIEVGAVMIRPEYRRSRGLLSLLRAVLRHRSEKGRGDEMYISNLVTSHELSQKLAAMMGMKPMALKVSTHPRARFLGLATGDGRESNLYGIRIAEKLSFFETFVPKTHREIAAELFAEAGLPVRIRTEPGEPAVRETEWHFSYYSNNHLGEISFDRIGKDFEFSLRRALHAASEERVDTLSLRLPTWERLPETIEQTIGFHRFFFCGFVHAKSGRWDLLYSRLANQRFSFDEVEVFDPVAKKLKAYVRASWEGLAAGKTGREG